MEEEYRMQKTQSDIQQVLSATSANGFSGSVHDSDIGTTVIHEDGTVVRPSTDDQVSTRGIISPSPTMQPVSIEDVNGNDNDNGPASAVPTIRISTESSRENDGEEEENGQEKSSYEENEDKDDTESKNTVDRKKEKGKGKEVYVDDDQKTSANGAVQQNGVQKHNIERPVQAAGEGDQNVNEASPAPAQEAFSFSNKRLCERWLDNLFMVLYEVGISFISVVDFRSFNNRFLPNRT